jgi:preprotein translocase subunit YajC
MFSLISEAHAQTTAATGAVAPAPQGPASNTMESTLMQFAPLFLIFAVFYFMLIRPQQKRFNDHKKMVEGMRRGDRVVTGGGFIGTVVRVDGDEAVVEIANGVQVTVVKSTITSINAKTEPDAFGKKD